MKAKKPVKCPDQIKGNYILKSQIKLMEENDELDRRIGRIMKEGL